MVFFSLYHYGGATMLKIENDTPILVGKKGTIKLNVDDEITRKLFMLYEGECEGIGPSRSSEKYGYTRQRYYQLLQQYVENGAIALKSKKTGPKNNYRRTDEAVRQVIRHKFLDPDASPEVIAQKITQCGNPISERSVERVVSDYGLQKKNYTHIIPKKSR
jgi:hypothetical protein